MNNSSRNLHALVNRFNSLHSLYRRGKFEVRVVENDNFFYVESDSNDAIDLQKAADRLFWQVAEYWEGANLQRIPHEFFREMIRSMVISFEIDEYFIKLSKEKRSFFENLRVEFFGPDHSEFSAESVREKIERFSQKVENYKKEDFVSFAYEVILLSMCGVNCLLLNQNAKSYLIALDHTRELERIIQAVLEIARSSPDKKALGVRGLNFFFQGRSYFALGQFRNAEEAYKKSASCYYEKMNLLAASTSQEDAETRTLSLRRAGLAEMIGLANLYLIESRIAEAFEIVERVSPLIRFAVGKQMIAYCDLIRASVTRAKYSSSEPKLVQLEKDVESCLVRLKDLQGKPHTYFKAVIELSIVRFFKVSEASSQRKADCYNKVLTELTSALQFAEKQEGRFANRRIAVEAITLRSHVYRNLAGTDPAIFEKFIDMAKDDAEKAIEYSQSLSQLESDAYVALGLVYRSLFLNSARCTEGDESDPNEFKTLSKTCFYRALDLNSEGNHRISAVCYLRLAELEALKGNANFIRANIFYDKYKQIRDYVGHQYILDFGTTIGNKLEDTRSVLYVDPEESLNLAHWEKRLKDFLIDQTVYYAALKHKNNLPNNRRRGERAKIGPSPEKIVSVHGRKRNSTRQSVLADFFRDEMGITSNDRYSLASQHLNEFEHFCEELTK